MSIRIKELWQRWRKDFWRLFRFGITGTICSLIHYAIYCLFLLFTNTTIAYTAGYGVGLLCNYGLTTYFTFKGKPSKNNVAGFVGSHILNYLLEIGLLHLFLWLGLSKWLSPIFVLVMLVPINLFLLRLGLVKGR